MKRRCLVVLMVLLASFGLARGEEHAPEVSGPAAYYYLQYEQEPWRTPESVGELMKKSGGVALAAAAVAAYLARRKRA